VKATPEEERKQREEDWMTTAKDPITGAPIEGDPSLVGQRNELKGAQGRNVALKRIMEEFGFSDITQISPQFLKQYTELWSRTPQTQRPSWMTASPEALNETMTEYQMHNPALTGEGEMGGYLDALKSHFGVSGYSDKFLASYSAARDAWMENVGGDETQLPEWLRLDPKLLPSMMGGYQKVSPYGSRTRVLQGSTGRGDQGTRPWPDVNQPYQGGAGGMVDPLTGLPNPSPTQGGDIPYDPLNPAMPGMPGGPQMGPMPGRRDRPPGPAPAGKRWVWNDMSQTWELVDVGGVRPPIEGREGQAGFRPWPGQNQGSHYAPGTVDPATGQRWFGRV
jgi:hypothetical protein